MFRESIARLLYSTVTKLSQLCRPKSPAAKAGQCAAESQPLDMEFDACNSGADARMVPAVVRQRNDVDPLYKRYDGYLVGSVSDNQENCAGAERWKLGRYSPLSSVENMPTFLSPYTDGPGFTKTLNGSYRRTLSEAESMNLIISSQLKLAILNRYAQDAKQKITAQEACSNRQPEQAFEAAIFIDQQDPFLKCADTEAMIEEEICLFDDQFTQDFISSCHVKVADPIDSELFPVGDQRISQPRSFAQLRALREEHKILQQAVEQLCCEDDPIVEEELMVESERLTEPEQEESAAPAAAQEETPFQRLFGQRQLLIDRTAASDGLVNETVAKRVPKHTVKPRANPNTWTGSVYSLDEKSNYFVRALPEYDGVDQVDTLNLTPMLDIEESKEQEDPWISSSEPAIGDEPVAAKAPPTEDDLECIRYIFSSEAQVHILKEMAENPDTAQYVLSQLAYHPDIDVRCAIADNTNAPLEARWLLAQDENQTVRYIVAENINTPAEVLAGLAKDDSPYINSRARRTLARLRGRRVVSVKFGSNILSLNVS
jgi:hypothetical protein